MEPSDAINCPLLPKTSLILNIFSVLLKLRRQKLQIHHTTLWWFQKLCFSPNFLKSEATKRSKGWAFLISEHFDDRLSRHGIVRKHLWIKFWEGSFFLIFIFLVPMTFKDDFIFLSHLIQHHFPLKTARKRGQMAKLVTPSVLIHLFLHVSSFPSTFHPTPILFRGDLTERATGSGIL